MPSSWSDPFVVDVAVTHRLCHIESVQQRSLIQTYAKARGYLNQAPGRKRLLYTLLAGPVYLQWSNRPDNSCEPVRHRYIQRAFRGHNVGLQGDDVSCITHTSNDLSAELLRRQLTHQASIRPRDRIDHHIFCVPFYRACVRILAGASAAMRTAAATASTSSGLSAGPASSALSRPSL